MVSIVLLTTEEVLQMNQYWYRLDTAWITEEMEPFDEVKPEHLFIKPLSRDTYYAKNPDIPRSESEDDTAITLNSFKKKHSEWKSKASVRRYDARRRKIYSSSCNLIDIRSYSTFNGSSRRVKSLAALNTMERGSVDEVDKVQAFLHRLLESVPPPPMEELQVTAVPNFPTHNPDNGFLDIYVPDYYDFEREKIFERNFLHTTSTMKNNCSNAETHFKNLI